MSSKKPNPHIALLRKRKNVVVSPLTPTLRDVLQRMRRRGHPMQFTPLLPLSHRALYAIARGVPFCKGSDSTSWEAWGLTGTSYFMELLGLN